MTSEHMMPPTMAAIGAPWCDAADVGWMGAPGPEVPGVDDIAGWPAVVVISPFTTDWFGAAPDPVDAEDLDGEADDPVLDGEAEELVLEGSEGLDGLFSVDPEFEDPGLEFDPEEVVPEDDAPEDVPPLLPEDVAPVEEDPEDEPPPTLETSVTNSDDWTGRFELLSEASDMYTAATPRLSSCDMTVL